MRCQGALRHQAARHWLFTTHPAPPVWTSGPSSCCIIVVWGRGGKGEEEGHGEQPGVAAGAGKRMPPRLSRWAGYAA